MEGKYSEVDPSESAGLVQTEGESMTLVLAFIWVGLGLISAYLCEKQIEKNIQRIFPDYVNTQHFYPGWVINAIAGPLGFLFWLVLKVIK